MSTSGELIERIRGDYLDDEVGVDEDYAMVSDTTLYRFINEAQRESCRRMDLIFDDFTTAVCSITLADGTRSYQLHKAITKLERVSYNGVELTKMTMDELDYSNPSWREQTGVPTQYVVRQRKIYPVPSPGADQDTDLLSLEVYREPLVVIEDDQDLEIPDEFHEDLIPWVLFRVYHKRDEDIFDPEKGKVHLAEFIERFGDTVPAHVRMHQFENPPVTTLRGNKGYSMTGNLSMSEEVTEDSDW